MQLTNGETYEVMGLHPVTVTVRGRRKVIQFPRNRMEEVTVSQEEYAPGQRFTVKLKGKDTAYAEAPGARGVGNILYPVKAVKGG